MNASGHQLHDGGANPMGGPSLEVLQIGWALSPANRLRSIDLGGGTGRNSIFLSTLGFDATLVEKDAELCLDARKASTERDLSIEIVCADVTTYVGKGPYDVVLLLGLLHFLPLQTAVSVMNRYRRLTTSGGVHIITISPPTGRKMDKNPLVGQGYIGSITKEVIERIYSDWSMLAIERYCKTDDHLVGQLDTHVIEKFVLVPDRHHTLATQVERVHLGSTGTMDGRKEELTAAIHSRQSKSNLELRFGPADFEASSLGSPDNLSLLGGKREAFEITVAFWGRVKCYFENARIVGFAVYETPWFHTFGYMIRP